jgi:hypothetical protein
MGDMAERASPGPGPAPGMSTRPATLGRAGLPWQFGVPPAVSLVPCGEQTHRVLWRRGKLVLEDHDLSAERALVGLGAERCACLELLGVGQQAFAGDRRLVLSGGVPRRRPTRLPRDLDRAATVARLVQQIRRWSRLAEEPGGAREALFRRLLSEFRDAVAASLLPSRQQRMVQHIDVKVRPLEPGADPTLEVEVMQGRVRIVAELSVSWLLQVWAWGLATVGGAVALEVVGAADDGRRLAATLLRWDVASPANVHRSSSGLTPAVLTTWITRDANEADDAGTRLDDPASGSWRLVDGPAVRPRLWWSLDVR